MLPEYVTLAIVFALTALLVLAVGAVCCIKLRQSVVVSKPDCDLTVEKKAQIPTVCQSPANLHKSEPNSLWQRALPTDLLTAFVYQESELHSARSQNVSEGSLTPTLIGGIASRKQTTHSLVAIFDDHEL